MEYKITYLILAFLFGIVLPLYTMLYAGKKAKELLLEYPDYRTTVYVQSIIFQWIVVAVILFAMWYHGDGLEHVGLQFTNQPLWVGGLLGITLIALLAVKQINISDVRFKKLQRRYEDVSYLIPSNEKEYRWAVGISYTAGICEEIIFRGFFYWQLIQFIPVVPALFIVNLMFALSHYATKRRNTILAFLFGIICSVIFIWTGSLWGAMVLHIVIDLFSLTEGKKFLAKMEYNFGEK